MDYFWLVFWPLEGLKAIRVKNRPPPNSHFYGPLYRLESGEEYLVGDGLLLTCIYKIICPLTVGEGLKYNKLDPRKTKKLLFLLCRTLFVFVLNEVRDFQHCAYNNWGSLEAKIQVKSGELPIKYCSPDSNLYNGP